MIYDRINNVFKKRPYLIKIAEFSLFAAFENPYIRKIRPFDEKAEFNSPWSSRMYNTPTC